MGTDGGIYKKKTKKQFDKMFDLFKWGCMSHSSIVSVLFISNRNQNFPSLESYAGVRLQDIFVCYNVHCVGLGE